MYFLYLVPLLVVLLEYTAVYSAVVYARYAVEYQQPSVDLFWGIVSIGGIIPYDAVPNLVVTLHVLGLFLSLAWLLYFMLTGWGSGINLPYHYRED